MLATYASARTPPAMIIIDSEEELFEMRVMAEASEEELTRFLSGYFSDNGIRTREHLISFLKLLDSLPLPFIPETQFNQIVYMVSSNDTYIVFSTEIGETYTLRYNFVDKNLIANREPLFKHYINKEKYINVYTYPNSHDSKLNEHGAISFIMEIDGFLVRAGYNRGDNTHITTFNPVEAYKDMVVTSFREAPWSTIPVSFTTTDALTILRAVAGLTALTDADFARYDVNGDGKIDTADALMILRIVAGL
jgi:hypothetical protein